MDQQGVVDPHSDEKNRKIAVNACRHSVPIYHCLPPYLDVV